MSDLKPADIQELMRYIRKKIKIRRAFRLWNKEKISFDYAY